MSRAERRAGRRRPRSPAQLWFFAGLLGGICLGLILVWAGGPLTAPDPAATLRGVEPAHYAALVALAWSVDDDRERARQRLAPSLAEGVDAAQHMAQMACRLAATDYVAEPDGRAALRSMMNFYQLAGRSGCADNLFPDLGADSLVLPLTSPTPTVGPTLVPPPSKTPVPSPSPDPGPVTTAAATSTPVLTVTAAAPRPFVLAGLSAFCDATRPALLVVYVQERNGRGIPAMALRVHWAAGEDRFFSGLKPEHGLAYADFVMQPGRQYRIEMPGRAAPSREFATGACVDDDGAATLRSWRAVFLPAN